MLPIIEHIKSFLLKYRYFLICICVLCVIIIFLLLSNFNNQQDIVQHKGDNIEHFASNNLHSNQTKSSNKDKSTDARQTTTVFVDLKGAVKRPDLYEMKSTDRVKQLLEKAGVQRDADLSQINLSEKLVDQKLIYIPKKGEVSQPNLSKSLNENNVNKSAKTENTKINLNLATESELQNVPGIGSSKAKAIIEYRNENGAFTTVEDLKKVNGIGVKTFEKLREYFIV